MTIQRGLSGQTDPVWGAVQKIPEGCAVLSGSCQLGGELDKRDQDGRLLSCRRGRCAPWPGGQRTAALTPGPPPLWQDTQGWPDPALPAAARKTGQNGSDPGGFTRERARRGHTQPEREEGAGRAGRVGPGCPAGAPPPWGCHSHPAVQPTQGAVAGRPAGPGGEERAPAAWVGAGSHAGSRPSLAEGWVRPLPRAGPGQAGSPAGPHRTALGLQGGSCLQAGERGCGCSSDYREVPPVTGRSAAAGFHIPAAPEKLRICTDFFFEPESPPSLNTSRVRGRGWGASLGSAGEGRGGRPPGKAKVIPGGQGPPLGTLPAQATAQAS